MLRIVNNNLDCSKCEANKLKLEITTFNLRELLEGVTRLMRHLSETKRLAFEIIHRPHSPPVSAR
ncbi:hypothetical protein B9J09_01755 [Xylella fastidiosa subsp. pauca]|uniref:Uncharacterized protein n=1 Tax=Xylella fastidiosa (strain 9a5c) TaxID=160492 RepID=Q9PGA3_XYLFA|nr:hypothetical protein XF_0399 [Xylella fastidiosa 9a5c]ALR08168.2 hypothetical protein XFFB_01685 [Xylella fastidiosa]ARO67958.1 hypothetical protein B9J09_01755 [Xylella fastidiosa subsp. pauca]ETE35599.1 hypothetical protein B398_01735 [Xylella fastidiosa 32]OJZ72414.1 hypothetical protein B375_0201855 [Xylella fastidiosa 6c]